MKKKTFFTEILILTIILFAILIHSDLLSTTRRSSTMNFHDFSVKMKDNKNFKIRFDGKLYESFYTEKKYKDIR